MNQGQILTQGSPSELINNYPHSVLQIHGSNLFPLRAGLGSVSGIKSICSLGDYFRISVDHPEETTRNINHYLKSEGLENYIIETDTPRLEDIFVGLLQVSQLDGDLAEISTSAISDDKTG